MSFLIFLFSTDIDAEFHGESDKRIKNRYKADGKIVTAETIAKKQVFRHFHRRNRLLETFNTHIRIQRQKLVRVKCFMTHFSTF